MSKGIYKRTKKHKQKISQTLKGRHVSPDTEFKKGMTWEEKYGVEKAKEMKKKMSKAKAMKGKGRGKRNGGWKLSEETKKKMSTTKREMWKNKEFAKKMLKLKNIKPNRMEIKLNKILQEHFPEEFKYVGNGEVIFGRKNPDFINCNGKKLIIELFGRTFHDPTYKKGFIKKILWHQQEVGTKMHYAQYGFKTLVIWDDELKNEEAVIEGIKEFIN